MTKYIFLISILFSAKLLCQSVNFVNDSIIIDSKLCFYFHKSNDSFFIHTLDNKKIIEWQVKSLNAGKFSTTYFFPAIEKQFYRGDINGRNALIFLLVQNKIIQNCAINEKKLLKFIAQNNQ